MTNIFEILKDRLIDIAGEQANAACPEDEEEDE